MKKEIKKQEFSVASILADEGIELSKEFDRETFFPGAVIPRLPQFEVLHQLAQIRMPDGKTTVDEFVGIIIPPLTQPNAWWQESFATAGGGKVPDCFSFDGVAPDTSVENPCNNLCATCKNNQFGTGEDGRGKACKNMVRVHFLIDNELFPVRLTVTPGNLDAVSDYSTKLYGKFQHYEIVTKVKIEKKTSSGGHSYAGITFENMGKAEEFYKDRPDILVEKYKAIAEIMKSELMTEKMAKEEITADEYGTHDPTQKSENDPY